MSDTPRIYVACLAAYNNGHLHGEWIDADQTADAIHEEIQAMLKASPVRDAEEWAIHDYEGFHGIKLGESESIERVSELAGLLDKHGAAFAAYVGYADDATERDFEEHYVGNAKSEADFAEEYSLEVYGEDGLGPLGQYIDWERVARDMFINDFYGVEEGGQVFVFRRG